MSEAGIEAIRGTYVASNALASAGKGPGRKYVNERGCFACRDKHGTAWYRWRLMLANGKEKYFCKGMHETVPTDGWQPALYVEGRWPVISACAVPEVNIPESPAMRAHSQDWGALIPPFFRARAPVQPYGGGRKNWGNPLAGKFIDFIAVFRRLTPICHPPSCPCV